MAQKFKVGQMVEDFEIGAGVIKNIDNDTEEDYPIDVDIDGSIRFYTLCGKYCLGQKNASLRLTGRPFNIGDRVMVGGEKGVITEVYPFSRDVGPTPVRVDMGVDNVWITKDGRAWPGTPIICEHDWQDEETVAEKAENGINALGEAAESACLCSKEVYPIAEMQEQGMIETAFQNLQKATEADLMPKYVKMALALEGIRVDLKTADLIREIVDSVNAHGGQYDLDTSCNIRQKIEQKYETA